ncbi:hypothetical protein DNI29_04380 [Hymenobacter sediminis]|uniref:hypothetical protein n=1 Tax=Hymenobacter sediminis TaxID=2218621 RepID=UPI000DA69899|nr:hypothetical protein [Hymenobacter sediminis]RPD50040.1 hypothetical protein DNI29_04380 [Hymenobacter sediminis]
MKTFLGDSNIPSFKIIGTIQALQSFEAECKQMGLQVSKANSYFRDDYEHCLMPCYAYDKKQPRNIKLQTLSADVYRADVVYDLATDHDLALAMVEVIQSVAEEWQPTK